MPIHSVYSDRDQLSKIDVSLATLQAGQQALATQATVESVKALIADKHADTIKWNVGISLTLVVAVTGVFFSASNWLKQSLPTATAAPTPTVVVVPAGAPLPQAPA